MLSKIITLQVKNVTRGEIILNSTQNAAKAIGKLKSMNKINSIPRNFPKENTKSRKNF